MFKEIIILPDLMFLIRSWYLLHWKTWFVIFMWNAVISLEALSTLIDGPTLPGG